MKFGWVARIFTLAKAEWLADQLWNAAFLQQSGRLIVSDYRYFYYLMSESRSLSEAICYRIREYDRILKALIADVVERP